MKKRRLRRWVKVTICLSLLLSLAFIVTLNIDFSNNVDVAEAEGVFQPQENIIEVEKFDMPEYEYLGTFLLTGYDDCPECQEDFVGMTALGVKPTVNRTVAVDPKVIPLGSHLLIDGVEYVAEDVGGAIKGYHIDIFVGSHEETFSSFCNKTTDVYLIK